MYNLTVVLESRGVQYLSIELDRSKYGDEVEVWRSSENDIFPAVSHASAEEKLYLFAIFFLWRSV